MPWETITYDAAAMRRQSRLWSAALASTQQQTMWGRLVQQLAADPPPQPPQEITTMGNPMNHLDAALARSARRVEEAKKAAKPADPVKFAADDHQMDGTVKPIAKPVKPPLGGPLLTTMADWQAGLPKALAVLREALKQDPEYRATWEANLSAAVLDAWAVSMTRRQVAEEASKRFMDALLRTT